MDRKTQRCSMPNDLVRIFKASVRKLKVAGATLTGYVVLALSLTHVHAQRLPAVRGSDASVLTPALLSQLENRLGADDAELFATRRGEEEYSTRDRAGFSQVSYRSTGIHLQAPGSSLGLSFAGWECGSTVLAPAAPRIEATKNRVEYRRGPVTEWYVNKPTGVEQGFTLASRPRIQGNPACTSGRSLALVLKGQSDLRFRMGTAGDGIDMVDRWGSVRMRYSQLSAVDASGRSLPARMEVAGQSIVLKVDDAQAKYPITVDPFIQTVKLSSPGSSVGYFGYSMAIDGNLLVVGSPNLQRAATDAGQVFVYQLTNGIYTLLATLTANNTTVTNSIKFFGTNVAIKNNVLVVGCSNSLNAYVYRVSGTTVTQLATLTGPTANGLSSFFGYSVATDGNYVIVGAPHALVGTKTNQGTIYLYQVAAAGSRSGSHPIELPKRGWLGAPVEPRIADSLQVDFPDGFSIPSPASPHLAVPLSTVTAGSGVTEMGTISGSDATAGAYVGWSVGISNQVIVASASGLPVSGHTAQGGAYVFQISGSNLTQLAKLTNSAGTTSDALGSAAAISGSSIALSSQARNSSTGEVDVYNAPASGWADAATPSVAITAPDALPYTFFGCSVSYDANTLAIGSYFATVGKSQDAGEVYLYTIAPAGATLAAQLHAADYGPGGSFGGAVALSGPFLAAGTLLQKSAYVFSNVQTAIALTASPGSVSYGTSTQLTATLTSNAGVPTGSIDFFNGSQKIAGGVPLANGVATTSVTLPAGTDTLVASYDGQGLFAAAKSNVLNYVVTPAILSVAADNKVFPYGAVPASLTYTITGLQNGDTASAIYTGTPLLKTTATSTSIPGPTYPIYISAGTLSLLSPNYQFVFRNGSLTIGAAGTVAPPVIDPATGIYSTAQTVTITDGTPGATVYYTLNGTIPSLKSPTYQGSFTVKKPTTVKAIAVLNGYLRSPMTTSMITIR